MAGAKNTSKYALMIRQTDLGNQTDSTTRKNRPHAQTLYRHAQPRMHFAEPIANVGKPYVRYRTRLIRCSSLRVEAASSPAAGQSGMPLGELLPSRRQLQQLPISRCLHATAMPYQVFKQA